MHTRHESFYDQPTKSLKQTQTKTFCNQMADNVVKLKNDLLMLALKRGNISNCEYSILHGKQFRELQFPA